MKKNLTLFALVLLLGTFSTSCYNVFSGGTGGLVVDAESTSSPKSGIANVDVYAYTDKTARDEDFSAWKEGTIFSPAAEYYGHTTTGSDGSFTISKLVWKESKPDFWKDADYTKIFFIFYHENYGLSKNESLIISDSSSDTVYQELTASRKTTVLNINFEDVSTAENTTNNIYVKISVPQTTSTNTSANPKIYDAVITGTGSISVNYPRWQSADDKAKGIETQPVISVFYEQSSDAIEWKACENGTDPTKQFAFLEDGFSISRKIKNPSYNLTFYGKSIKLSVPSFSGQYTNTNDSLDDGVVISLKAKNAAGEFAIDCGEVTTVAQTKGTTSEEKHGVFSNLGNGYFWFDTNYTDRYAQTEVQIFADGNAVKTMTIRSDTNSYNIQL